MCPQLPPKRDETALQEEEELQLALALSQSEAEEKERMVSWGEEGDLRLHGVWGARGAFLDVWGGQHCGGSGCYAMCSLRDTFFLVLLQRQKSAYTAYPKAEPAPVASSAPPASSLYSSPVVSTQWAAALAWTASRGRQLEGCPRKDKTLSLGLTSPPHPHPRALGFLVRGPLWGGGPAGESSVSSTTTPPRQEEVGALGPRVAAPF